VKLKKILASILCVAMVLSTMSFSVFAEATVYEVANDEELAEALNNAVDYDIIKLAAGEYTGGISVGANITLEGSVDADGNPTTVFSGENDASGSYYDYSIYMNKGTIKNIKIINAWKGIMTEGAGSLTIDNVTMVKIAYGIHIAEAKNAEDTVTVENSHLDITWANSFCGGEYKIIMTNNVFTAEEPYYGKGSGANAVNTFNPNTTVSENIFEEDAKMLIREEAKDGVEIGPNYYADGIENALNDSGAEIVKIDTYYTDREMTNEVEAPKGTITYGYTRADGVWGEGTSNAKEHFVVELYSGDEKIAQASLKDYNDIIDGDLYVTWSIPFSGADSNYWEVDWYGSNPYVDTVPTNVVLWVDGMKVAKNIVQMNGPDNLWPVKWDELENVPAAAKLGNKRFGTIQAAVDAAVEGDNEIVILPGTYDESFTVSQKANTNITITAENKGDVTLTGTIYVNGNNRYYDAETLTISNLVFDGSDKTEAHKFIYDYNTATDSNRTYAHNLTVANCDFTGDGSLEDETAVQAVYCRQGNDIVIDGCTATNMHSLLWTSNTSGLTITNCKVTNCESVTTITSSPALTFTNNTVDVANFAVRTGQSSASTNTVADITMNDNTIKAGVTALVLRNATATVVMTENDIDAPAVFTNENSDNSTINGVAIVSDEIDSVISAANKMTLKFELVEPGLYNIVLAATDIYEFVGAELTFTNTSETVAGEYMNYEILGIDGVTNAEKSIEKADTYALRLVDGAARMSGEEIIIGQVKFYGQGDINFTVSEGKVVTTQYGTNLGQYYTVDADATTDDNLVIEGITNGAVEEVTRTVVVNVAYKHALDGTYWSDNQITVTLKDGFGNVYDAEDLTEGVATINNVKLGRLTVTLEAPGFRKYVYNTTLEAGADANDALVLNFWNDIKRGTVQSPLAEIEAGVSGETDKNFVVGDIVMDYTVDEYDLAAVTSYYGMYELEDADKYIKYDLNRDGNIDIIDVHYVLHTLGN